MSYNASDVHMLYTKFEDSFSWSQLHDWCCHRPVLPVAAVSIYVLILKFGPQLMSDRKSLSLRPALFAWNAGLALFSLMASFRAVSYIAHNLRQSDFSVHKVVCDNSPDNVTAFWVFAFTLSKFVELGDTVFLLVRKKRLLFLHWYHHLTVLLFTWTATIANAPVGKFFAMMNVIVHSVMYSYFAARSLGLRPPRVLSVGLTIMQIVQMIAGMGLLMLSHRLSHQVPDCRSPAAILVAGLLIYGSYFCLFVHFFVNAYLRPGQREGGGDHNKQE